MSVRDLARAHVAALGHQQRPSCPNGTALEVSQRDKRPISPQYQKDKLSHDVGTAGQLRPGGTLRQAGTNRTLGTDGTLGAEGTPVGFGAADYAERAAIMEADAGMPFEWADTFAAISQASPPGDFTPERWQGVLDGMLRFCDEWAGRAAALGWQPHEIFSLDLVTPQARLDRRGLGLLLSNNAWVVALDDCGADILTPAGSRQRYYREPR
jgi:hypothetical protein